MLVENLFGILSDAVCHQSNRYDSDHFLQHLRQVLATSIYVAIPSKPAECTPVRTLSQKWIEVFGFSSGFTTDSNQ